jgi:ferritin-like metal-binding protein YciE
MNVLFMHQVQGIYYTGTQLVNALPKMAEKVAEKQPKRGF